MTHKIMSKILILNYHGLSPKLQLPLPRLESKTNISFAMASQATVAKVQTCHLNHSLWLLTPSVVPPSHSKVTTIQLHLSFIKK